MRLPHEHFPKGEGSLAQHHATSPRQTKAASSIYLLGSATTQYYEWYGGVACVHLGLSSDHQPTHSSMPCVLPVLLARLLSLLLLLVPTTTRDSWRTSSSQTPTGCSLSVLPLDSEWASVNWSQPFVMHNVSEGWAASHAWRDQRAFLRQHGALQQHARWGVGSRQFGTVSRPTSVHEYVHTMHTDNGTGLLFGDATGSLRPAGGDWNIPQVIKDAGLLYPMVSIGPSDEGLGFHNHGATWECVVVGQKHILLFEPIGAESGTDRAEDWAPELAAQYLTPTAAWMKQYNTSLRAQQLPKLRYHGQPVALQTCLLQEGMAVYIPCNWWHATRNVGDAVAVGATGDVEPAHCAADRFADSEEAATRVAQEQANGNLDKAEVLLRKACRLAPYNIACVTSLALLLTEMNRPSEAEEVLASAAAKLTEAHRMGWLPAQPLSAGLLKLAEQLLALGRQSAERAGAVVAEAARADRHNAKAQVNHLFLRIGQSKTLLEMRHLLDEASTLADDLSISVNRIWNADEKTMPVTAHADKPPTFGSRFYQVADQGVTLSDCSSKHNLATGQEVLEQLRSGIVVVRERLASLEASELTERQRGVYWDCLILSLGMLSVLLALPE